MEKKPKPKDQVTTKQLLIIIPVTIIVVVLIFRACDSCMSGPEKQYAYINADNWDTCSYELKQAWIQEYMSDPDDFGYSAIGSAIEAIKLQCRYPSTVKLDRDPVFANCRIVEADSGWVFSDGRGVAKNAFGVEASFLYSVKYKITPAEVGVLEVSISD